MKKFWPIVFLSMIMLMLWTKFAFAAPDAPTTPVARVGADIMELLAYALGTLISVLIARLIHALGTKYKVDVPDPWLAKIQKLVDLGIGYAEEQGRKAMKKVDAKASAALPDKLEIAATFVLDAADDKKLTAKGKEWLKKQIEARLHTKRMNDEPFTQVTINKTEEPKPEPKKPDPSPTLDGKTVRTARRSDRMGAVYLVTFTDGSAGEYTGMQLAAAGVIV